MCFLLSLEFNLKRARSKPHIPGMGQCLAKSSCLNNLQLVSLSKEPTAGLNTLPNPGMPIHADSLNPAPQSRAPHVAVLSHLLEPWPGRHNRSCVISITVDICGWTRSCTNRDGSNHMNAGINHLQLHPRLHLQPAQASL